MYAKFVDKQSKTISTLWGQDIAYMHCSMTRKFLNNA